jgi:hypothetical protein
VVEASEGFDEHVHTFIPVFVPSGGEEVEGLFWIEIVVTIEMTSDEFGDAVLVDLMQVLEFVRGGEFLHIQTIGQNTVGLSLEQVLALVSRDMADRGEDISRVCGTTLDTVAVVDATLPRFGVDIKVLQVVVEIDRTGTEISAQQGGMGGEDGGDVDLSFPAEGEGDTREPLVELRDDGTLLLMVGVLLLLVGASGGMERDPHTSPKNQATR